MNIIKDKKTKEPYPLKLRMGHQVIRKAREKGVIIRPLGDVVVLMPPLSTSFEELEMLTSVVYESIKEVTES